MDTTTNLTTITQYWPVAVAIGLGTAGAYWLMLAVQTYLNRRYLKHREMVWLEVTPPATIAKTPEATQQLFSVIHGLRAGRPIRHRLLGRSPVLSFEITSTRKEGIRYLIQTERQRSESLQKIITSYIPDCKVKECTLRNPKINTVVEFKQSGHYVLPITETALLEQHDPLAYVTGALTKLSDNDQITMQLVIQPVQLREAKILSHKILGNENILQHVSSKRLPIAGKGLRAMNSIVNGATELVGEVHTATTYGYKTYYNSQQKQVQQASQAVRGNRPARSISRFEQEVMESMHRKVNQPLFRVSLRFLITSPDAAEHASALRSALDGFSVPPYQELRAKHNLPVLGALHTKFATKRLPALSQRGSLILSTAELASLYHFPSTLVSKTDNLISSLSRTLPAPVSLKSGRELAITIGENHHHGSITPIGLTEAERERHIYVIGGTGNGKTTMLFYEILQDIRAGNGIAVLDPHGDLAERILRYIPQNRIEDVIYLNPDDLTYPIGMNLLELDSSLTGDDLLREKDLITEATISVLRKIFSDDDSGGHRIEYVLRNAIQTALTLEGSTLFTIFELLNDAKYRRSVVKNLEDKNLKDFWSNELGKAGEFQRVKMAAGITAKIGRFLFSASARRVLEQEKSTIDFEDILATNKILICNFSKGLLGEDTSTLFGTTVLAKLQTASLRRARIGQDNRTPFYLYVDEFQNFATMSFVQMLSEARKYKLFLTMAEQSTAQQDEQRLVDIILANVGTVVCFRSGSPADERLVLPLFSPYIQQAEIANLPAYSYYVRIAALDAQEPISGVTIVVSETGDEAIAQRVIESSRRRYAKQVQSSQPAQEQPRQVAKTKERRKTVQDKALLEVKPLS